MSVRQEILSTIKNIEFNKVDLPKKVSTYFGENTFSMTAMRKHISKTTFDAFKLWMSEGKTISL
ncbi:MAG: hypothetical protein M0Q96_05785, partial [Candidatus Omnitrophica bacterium]|nr:hypothetical protein [Candidatus Omnitrophota bacterium]